MKLFKLTDGNDCTHGRTKWKEGGTLSLPKIKNPQLCEPGVIHAYKNINLAFLLNPIHANFKPAQVWEAEGNVCIEDWGKVGCFELTTTKKLPIPKWIGSGKEMDVRILFAILCAESVLKYYENKYPKDDRPRKAIEAAKEYLKDKAADAAHAAAYAAHAAAHAAYAAAYAAYAADAADAAYAAAHAAAYAAAHAADAAAYAADAAAYAADAAAYAADAAAYAADAAAYAAYAADAPYAADALDFCAIADNAVEG